MAHLRNATPDSEVLASSDDDGHPINRSISSLRSQPTRRGSWMSEVQPRKQSFTGSISSNQSKPTTPAGDTTPWPSAHSFGTKTTTANPLIGGAKIWGNVFSRDNNAATATGGSSFRPSKAVDLTAPSNRIGDRETQAQVSPGAQYEHSALPVAIDLQPTPKATRSSSYSYGQQERKALGPILGTDLSQVTEEVDDGYDSDDGTSLDNPFMREGEASSSTFQIPLQPDKPLTSFNTNHSLFSTATRHSSIDNEEDMATIEEIRAARYNDNTINDHLRSQLYEAGVLRTLPSISTLGECEWLKTHRKIR